MESLIDIFSASFSPPPPPGWVPTVAWAKHWPTLFINNENGRDISGDLQFFKNRFFVCTFEIWFLFQVENTYFILFPPFSSNIFLRCFFFFFSVPSPTVDSFDSKC
jgi:hypothetical protein